MSKMWCLGLHVFCTVYLVLGKLDSNEDLDESVDRDIEDSGERIGAEATQVLHHPYAAALLHNNNYTCSAVVLNTYWLLTLSKCFDSEIISSYVTHRNLANFTVRAGSSYNNKGGSLYKIKMLINNFDLKVSAVKLEAPLVFGSKVQSVHLPNPDEGVTLGYLASILAWTPTGHMRLVNVPIIESSICDDDTKLLPGHYICVGGVQDPNRNFCRQDNGGAVIQNNTLIAMATFFQTCALYTKTHAFPKVSSFARWLDSVIWDEDNRPATSTPTSTTQLPKQVNVTEKSSQSENPYFIDPSKYMLTLPFEPVNVPLEPAEDNSVIPRISLYESYLQNIAKGKTTTTQDPTPMDDLKREWFKKFGQSMMMMPPQMYMGNKFEQYDYN